MASLKTAMEQEGRKFNKDEQVTENVCQMRSSSKTWSVCGS